MALPFASSAYTAGRRGYLSSVATAAARDGRQYAGNIDMSSVGNPVGTGRHLERPTNCSPPATSCDALAESPIRTACPEVAGSDEEVAGSADMVDAGGAARPCEATVGVTSAPED